VRGHTFSVSEQQSAVVLGVMLMWRKSVEAMWTEVGKKWKELYNGELKPKRGQWRAII